MSIGKATRLLLFNLHKFTTGRNEVLAKVIFSQTCVKNSVHGGGGRVPDQAPPPDQAGTPPGPGRYPPSGPGRYPPRTRQVPPPWTRQVHTHPPCPPGTRPPPPEQQTPEYGQRSAGTHPTGMHSCIKFKIKP